MLSNPHIPPAHLAPKALGDGAAIPPQSGLAPSRKSTLALGLGARARALGWPQSAVIDDDLATVLPPAPSARWRQATLGHGRGWRGSGGS